MKYKDGKLLTDDSQPAYESEEAKEAAIHAANQEKLKSTGVEFNGVMCSAQEDDDYKLAGASILLDKGRSVSVTFTNGNNLLLTPDNRAAFEAVWIPFREQFYA